MSKVYWLGMRVENPTESLEYWLENGGYEEGYSWEYIMCFYEGNKDCISFSLESLEERKSYLEKN